MPIPKPRMGDKPESQSDYMGRCMGDSTMMQDYPKQAQRVAVCMNTWRTAHPGAKPAPKQMDMCQPEDNETQADFMDRCVGMGHDEAACQVAWEMDQADDAAGKSVEMKWMPSLLEVKGLNDGVRMIRGIATTPSVDHVGDIVESMGAKYNLPIPLLWMHDHKQPVGHVTFVEPNAKGIPFEAHIAKIDEPGELKDRVDNAWQHVKAGLVKGVSIGFTPIRGQVEAIKDGGLKFKQWKWHELSLVTVPAQSDAQIQLIRSIDTEALQAATGLKQSKSVANPAGVTARATAKKPEGTMAKTIAENIAAYATTRAAHAARMDELMTKASEEGVTLDEEQSTEYDELGEKITAIDAHLKRLREQEKRNVELAVVVDGDSMGRNTGESMRRPLAQVQVKRPPNEPGTAFVRYVTALAMARGNIQQAAQIAQRDGWKDTPEVSAVLQFAAMEGTTQLKAPVSPSTTYDPAWSGPLVYLQYMTSEFISLLRPATVLDRITGMRRVPFNIRVPTQTAGSTAYWVGEGSMKPLSSLAFSTITMTFAKVAALVTFTQESLRFSNPSLEALVRQDMIDAIALKLDTDLLSPTKAQDPGAGGPSPASLTNGVTPILASGTDYVAAQRDIKNVLVSIANLNIPMTNGVWVMHPSQAIAFSLMLNPLGQREYPTVTPEGGTLAGFRIITTTNIPASGGSPSDGYMIAFICPGEILLADDGNVTIDASDQASLQFESAPDSPVTASTNMVSLWQQNMIALRAEREINWYKRRAGSVAYIDYARYSP